MSQQLGTWLRTQRQARGWDVPEMARRLAKAAGHTRGTLPDLVSLGAYIRRWERNANGITERYKLLYSTALSIKPGQFGQEEQDDESPSGSDLPRMQARHDLPAPSPVSLAILPRPAELLHRQCQADIMLPQHDLGAELAGVAGGEELLDTAEQVALGRPAQMPYAGREVRIGQSHIAQIEAITAVFRGWDNEYGGGLRRGAVVGQLNGAAMLLDGPFHDEQAGRRFFSAIADLAQLVGWMTFDLHLHATAQRYYLLGLRLAKDAGDRAQVARLLYCLARQMVDLGQPREALDLAQSGLYAIRRSSVPKATAMLRIIEARSHACTGDAKECHNALGLAQDAFSRVGANTDPEWCGFFDEGELCGLVGVTLRDLALCDADHAHDHAADAMPWIERAVRQRPRAYLRSKVLDVDGLAVTSLLLGEPEAAAEHAISAISLARDMTSSRVTSKLRRTVRLAEQRFPNARGVAGLGEQIRGLAHPA
jgi:transcriptional regulator with XRE-family HTH domain